MRRYVDKKGGGEGRKEGRGGGKGGREGGREGGRDSHCSEQWVPWHCVVVLSLFFLLGQAAHDSSERQSY